MELGVRRLGLNEATAPLVDGEEDPYQLVQVHDYRNVSFLRMDPRIRAASRETISAFSTAYPELLAHKYFVNVPAIMSWVFSAMKLFLAPATVRKFHPMSSGTFLAAELPDYAASLPAEYGGRGPGVTEGMTVRLGKATPPKEPASSTEAVPVADAAVIPQTEVEAEGDQKADDAQMADLPKPEADASQEEDRATAQPEDEVGKAELGPDTTTEEEKQETTEYISGEESAAAAETTETKGEEVGTAEEVAG